MQMDPNQDGHVDFDEFYAWWVDRANPSNKAAELLKVP